MSLKLWQIAEQFFDQQFTGKDKYVHHFRDAKAVMNQTQIRKVLTDRQPADRLVCDNGYFFFAEVKSCSDAVSFAFSGIQIGQWQAAKQVVAAKGDYFFFIKSEHLNQWYKIPAIQFLAHRELGHKSMKWTLMKGMEWVTAKSM